MAWKRLDRDDILLSVAEFLGSARLVGQAGTWMLNTTGMIRSVQLSSSRSVLDGNGGPQPDCDEAGLVPASARYKYRWF